MALGYVDRMYTLGGVTGGQQASYVGSQGLHALRDGVWTGYGGYVPDI